MVFCSMGSNAESSEILNLPICGWIHRVFLKLSFFFPLASLWMLLLCCFGTAYGQAKETKERSPISGLKEAEFCGVLESIEPLPQSRGLLYYPVDLDPRYYLLVKTDSPVALGIKRYDESRVQVFGIHSPTRYFQGEARQALGKRFKFLFRAQEGTNKRASLEIVPCDKN